MLQQGTTVAGYRVDGVLGEGGMATVYRATQLSLNRTVALKLLAAELSDDEAFRQRFRREGQLQAAIDHQHIVPVYEAGQTEHGLFLAMRLITGSTLKDLILSERLEPRRSLRLLAQVAQALDAAHQAGLIHRDIKPQNILIGHGDHVYLADFGLTKAPDEASITGTGQFMGTIDYVAPEQIRGETATGATDCYSLTSVLYECLVGEVPFARPNEVATLHAQLTEPPPKLSEHRPELPAALDDVIARGLAKDPAERPSSCSELIRLASRAISTSPGADALAPSQETRPSASPAGLVDSSQLTRGYGTPVPTEGLAPVEPTVKSEAPAAATLASGAVGEQARAATPPGGPPAAAAPARATGLSPGWVALLAALALAVIVGGFLIGHSGSSSAPPTYANVASVANVQLRYPATWQLGSIQPAVLGLHFSDPVTLTTSQGTAGLQAGVVPDAVGPSLLPPSVSSRATGGLRKPEVVVLGEVQAYRYRDLTVPGVPPASTVYVIPTSAGVVTIACSSPPKPPGDFQDQCDRIAATLHLIAATAYGLGPGPATAKLLSSTFSRLRDQVAASQALLKAAHTPAAQAAAASALAGAYKQAATRLSGATYSPRDRPGIATLAAALRRLSSGYAKAASAARSGSRAAYQRASSQVAQGSKALSEATSGLSGLGYRVAS